MLSLDFWVPKRRQCLWWTELQPPHNQNGGEDPLALAVGTLWGGCKGIWLKICYGISAEYIIITFLHLHN